MNIVTALRGLMNRGLALVMRGHAFDPSAWVESATETVGAPPVFAMVNDDPRSLRCVWPAGASVREAIGWIERHAAARVSGAETLTLVVAEGEPTAIDADLLQVLGALQINVHVPAERCANLTDVDDETCQCVGGPALVLMDRLGVSPLACSRCRGDVAIARCSLPPEIESRLVRWLRVHRALHQLWLDSGPYDGWAADEMSRPDAPSVREATELVREIGQFHDCYRYAFDAGRSTTAPHEACPGCAAVMIPAGRFQTCDRCRIATG